MNRIDDLKDETIKTLARTLKSSGLAASETEAIRMATNMATTNKKANESFEEKKEKNIMGLSFLHKESKKEEGNQKIVEEVAFAEEADEYNEEPQEYNELSHDCNSCSGCTQENKEPSLSELFEAETKDEFIAQDILMEKEETAPKKEETIDEEPKKPEKDLSKYKESKVNLGEVFKFQN